MPLVKQKQSPNRCHFVFLNATSGMVNDRRVQGLDLLALWKGGYFFVELLLGAMSQQ